MVNYISPLVPVFQYVLKFQDETSFTLVPEARGSALGVSHGDDTFFLFKFSELEDFYPYWSPGNIITSARFSRKLVIKLHLSSNQDV